MSEDIMLDLETMAIKPNAAITQIGAVKFNLETLQVESKFQIYVDLESSVRHGLLMDASTVQWWLKQDIKAKESNVPELNLVNALGEFSRYITDVKNVRIWGNGVDFDNVILKSAYDACDIELPWCYWNNMCYRTVKNMNKNIKIQRTGVHHLAVDDAMSQTHHLLEITKRNLR